MQMNDAQKHAIECADAWLNDSALPTYSKLSAALEQIERLSREADGNMVDVRAMLGDIARTAIASTAA